jgi:hypothetical protein
VLHIPGIDSAAESIPEILFHSGIPGNWFHCRINCQEFRNSCNTEFLPISESPELIPLRNRFQEFRNSIAKQFLPIPELPQFTPFRNCFPEFRNYNISA